MNVIPFAPGRGRRIGTSVLTARGVFVVGFCTFCWGLMIGVLVGGLSASGHP